MSQSNTLPAGPEDFASRPPENRRQIVMAWVVAVVAAVFLIWLKPGVAYNIGAFLLTLGVLVFVHEFGHFQFALWSGMKVNRFGIGFPPWLLSVQRNGIIYSVGALPIGGMVDIAGLGSEEEMLGTVKGEHVVVRAPRHDLPHGQRQFQDASLFWRFCTLFAGPFMNFLFALVIFIAVYSIFGVPDEEKSYTTNQIDGVMSSSPAEAIGIRKGDRLVAVNGKRSNLTKILADLIHNSEGKPVTVTVARTGKEFTQTVRPNFDEVDLEPGVSKKLWRIGIRFHEVEVKKRVGFGQAVVLGGITAGYFVKQILGFIRRAVTGKLTKTDTTSVRGPVGIAQIAGETARLGFDKVALFAAALSVNLGLINLLPIPALDGGRILFLGYELLFRRPLDPRRESMVHTFGMLVLLAFMLFITLWDVLRPKA